MAVMGELERRGSALEPYEVAELAGCTTPYLAQHAAAGFDKHKRRQFFELACYLQSNCFNESEDVADVCEEARRRLDGAFPESAGTSTMGDAARGVHECISRNLAGGRELTGCATGFAALDARSGGFSPRTSSWSPGTPPAARRCSPRPWRRPRDAPWRSTPWRCARRR